MNSLTKALVGVSGLLGILCVILTILLISAKAEVAVAKAEVATVRLHAEESEAEARKAIARVSEVENRRTEYDQRRDCLATLTRVDSAKEQWAMDNRKPIYSELPDGVLVSGGYVPGTPACPAGGGISIARMGESPSCSVHGPLVTR